MHIKPVGPKSILLLSLTFLAFTGPLNAYSRDTHQVFTASIGMADTKNRNMTINASSVPEEYNALQVNQSGNHSYSLAWGLKEDSALFSFEYYSINTDANVASFEQGEMTTRALFYSGYWVPEAFYGISAVVGAGVGYGFQKLKHVNDSFGNSSMDGRGLSYKLSLGAHYKLFPNLSVYGLVEQHSYSDLSDSYSYSDGATDQIISRTLPKSKINLFNLGIMYSI